LALPSIHKLIKTTINITILKSFNSTHIFFTQKKKTFCFHSCRRKKTFFHSQSLLSMEVDNTSTILSQNNKENVPPACNTNKVKNKNNTNCKRVPLTDITNLFNNSAKTTFTIVHQQQVRVSDLPGKTLRMGFR